MKHFSKAVILCAVVFLTAGCRNIILQGGRYNGRDRGEFAVVYKDLIFLRVKAAENIPGALTYWEWGGKYSIDPDSKRLRLDMPREIGKLWKYSYNIQAGRHSIVLEDLSKNKKFYLNYEYPVLRRKPANAPRPMSSPGVDPVYQPLAPLK